MTDINKQELRGLAEAQPVKKLSRTGGDIPDMGGAERMYYVTGPTGVSDYEDWGFTRSAASYIAAACPANVLALLDVIQTLEIRLREVAKACATAEQERDQLRKVHHG